MNLKELIEKAEREATWYETKYGIYHIKNNNEERFVIGRINDITYNLLGDLIYQTTNGYKKWT